MYRVTLGIVLIIDDVIPRIAVSALPPIKVELGFLWIKRQDSHGTRRAMTAAATHHGIANRVVNVPRCLAKWIRVWNPLGSVMLDLELLGIHAAQCRRFSGALQSKSATIEGDLYPKDGDMAAGESPMRSTTLFRVAAILVALHYFWPIFGGRRKGRRKVCARDLRPPGLGGKRSCAKRIPALSVALVDDQTVVWADGFGHIDVDKKNAGGPAYGLSHRVRLEADHGSAPDAVRRARQGRSRRSGHRLFGRLSTHE